MNGPECAAIRDDLAAWVLGALESDDRTLIDQHVSWCVLCRMEADRWLWTSIALPMSLDPVEPSGQAKHLLMDRVAADQMGALTPAPASHVEVARTTTAAGPSPPPRRFVWSQALVAPLIIALIAMTAWSFNLRDEVDSMQEEDGPAVTTTSDSMLPEGVQTFGMRSECQQCASDGRFLANPETGSALFVAWNLDPDMVHEVWCVDDLGVEELVASLKVNRSGDVVQPLLFDQPIAGYSQIYVMSKNDGIEQMMEMNETPMATPAPQPDA